MRRGFTLIELLVGVALLSVMGALTYGIIASFFAVQRDTDDMVDANHMARVVLNRLQRDLSQAFLTLNQGLEEKTKSVFIGDRDRVVFTFVGNIPTTTDGLETDQGTVEYHLGDTSKDREGRDLLRRFEPVIDNSPESGGSEVPVATGVTEFKLEYWDEKSHEWDDQWKADDPLSTTEPGYTLPLRVKIVLELMDPQDQKYRFETQTPIYMTRPLLFGQPISATAQQWKAATQIDKAAEKAKAGLPPGLDPQGVP